MTDFNDSTYTGNSFGAEAAYVQSIDAQVNQSIDAQVKKTNTGVLKRFFGWQSHVVSTTQETNPCAPRVRTRAVNPDDEMARLWEYGC